MKMKEFFVRLVFRLGNWTWAPCIYIRKIIMKIMDATSYYLTQKELDTKRTNLASF